jgi:hypothetical protein
MSGLSELLDASALLPFGHLQLPARAFRACNDVGAVSIKDVSERLVTERKCAASVGLKTEEEIRAAFQVFAEHTDEWGRTDWPAFWKQRPIARPGVFITTPSLESLAPEIRNEPIGALHLDKACSGLEAVNIRTIGELIDAARVGIPKLRNFGAKAHSEVVSALSELSASLNGSNVDWIAYAQRRNFTIVPVQPDSEIGSTFWERVFPNACEKVIKSQFDERAWLVFSKRLLASADDHETLDNIGKVYGITRERVRQVEEECLNALRKPLLQGDYRGLNFRFRSNLIDQFRAAQEQFDLVALPAWTKTRWLEELSETWRVASDALSKRYRLLAEIFGYRAVRSDNHVLDPLIVRQSTGSARVRRLTTVIGKLHELLSGGDVMDAFAIAKSLIKSGVVVSSVDEVPSLIELCSTAESIGENLYRQKFEFLRGRANQVIRILDESGQPMHYRDVIRELNSRLSATKRVPSKSTLTNQIRTERRIVTIGKSGMWALADWGVETRSLIDLIEEVLATAGEAIHVDEITERVLEQRPGSEASIVLLLGTHPKRFRKVAPHLYALTEWGDSVGDENWLDKDGIARFVASFFAERTTESVEFRELQEAFSRQTGLSTRSARGVLSHHPAVKVDRLDYNTRIASYETDWALLPIQRKTRHAPLQTDIIVNAVKAKLALVPTGERPLVDIVKEVETDLGIGRQNIYAAIKQSKELETIAVEDSVFKICRVVGRSFAAFPQLTELRNNIWQSECERAIAKLNVDEVDLGLFLLGRQFDHAMRYLLETARDHAGAAVLDGHLARLQSRIDWAVNKGVFRDKATLTLLKIERNEHGHEPPTLEERRAIMKFAPYLAGLYIDYLIMINHRAQHMVKTGSI